MPSLLTLALTERRMTTDDLRARVRAGGNGTLAAFAAELGLHDPIWRPRWDAAEAAYISAANAATAANAEVACLSVRVAQLETYTTDLEARLKRAEAREARAEARVEAL